eukprot:SAG31_NODE_2727_length_5181_cov_7.977568_4_plen_442_part_00
MGCCVSNSAIMYAQAATEAERVQMRHEAQPQTVAAPSKPQDAAARQHEASCHAATQLVDLAIVGAIDDAVAAHRTLTAHKASAASAWATEQAAKAEAASARLEEPVDTEEVVQLAASEKGFPVDECPAVMPDLSQHHTLAAQVLRENPGIYKQLRTLVTSSGVPFARCVKTTFDHAGHPKLIMVGAVAGDAECYSTFAPFFDRLIEARHWGVSAAAPSDLNHSRVKHCGTLDPEGSYIRNVRVRSARSICGFRFPPACSLEERREVELVLVRALHKAGLGGSYTPMPGSNSAGRLSAAGLSAALDQSEGTLASLARRGYLFGQPRSPVLTTSGMARDWPDARGVFCTNMDLGQNSAALVCWVNEEDHLRLMALSAGANIRHVFEVFSKAVHAVEAALGDNTDKEGMAGAGFAHTKQHGYLLTCPSNIGARIDTILCATALQ